MFIKSATMKDVIDVNREYSIEEIKKFICNSKIYPIRKISIMCDNKLKINMSKDVNEIKILSKIVLGKIDVNHEYFDIVLGLIRKKLSLNRIYIDIKSYLLEFNNNIKLFRIYNDKYYTYMDEVDER